MSARSGDARDESSRLRRKNIAPFPAMHMAMHATAAGRSRGQSGGGAPAAGRANGRRTAAKRPIRPNEGARSVHAGFPEPRTYEAETTYEHDCRNAATSPIASPAAVSMLPDSTRGGGAVR